jgi:hypothetical protein
MDKAQIVLPHVVEGALRQPANCAGLNAVRSRRMRNKRKALKRTTEQTTQRITNNRGQQ